MAAPTLILVPDEQGNFVGAVLLPPSARLEQLDELFDICRLLANTQLDRKAAKHA